MVAPFDHEFHAVNSHAFHTRYHSTAGEAYLAAAIPEGDARVPLGDLANAHDGHGHFHVPEGERDFDSLSCDMNNLDLSFVKDASAVRGLV